MTERSVTALQLCPFSDYLEAGLNKRFDMIRWFELDAEEQQQWLAQHAGTVRGEVTGGHIQQ